MGEAEFLADSRQLIIRSHFVIYGDAASHELAGQIARDIAFHWNEPSVRQQIRGENCQVLFDISGEFIADLNPETVWFNDNPRLNFFRVEEYVTGNISFVDGLSCNTGYFKLDNLRQTSTTAAHEYGHTLGLDHPDDLDIRGVVNPGIMYPRGTICDPHFQYNPTAAPGQTGGTLDPAHRRVREEDIRALKLHRLRFHENNRAVIGGFSSFYHAKHEPPPAS